MYASIKILYRIQRGRQTNGGEGCSLRDYSEKTRTISPQCVLSQGKILLRTILFQLSYIIQSAILSLKVKNHVVNSFFLSTKTVNSVRKIANKTV